MKKLIVLAAALLVAVSTSWAQVRSTAHVPTPFTEGGAPVTLEMVIYKPEGAGPFPTVLFNHGSTGMGDTPSLFKETWAPEKLARWFTQRGWLVAFPQRRGRGQSDGQYDEGFTPKRDRYSCDPTPSLAGFDRALADVDAAAVWLQQNPDVDAKRMEIAGWSRGGILAVAYAGTHPDVFQGVINFAGGWMSDQCPLNTADAINPVSFRRGAAFVRPTLWLYGEKDPYYALAHSRKNFEAFIDAGGKGSFETFKLPPGVNAHLIFTQQDLWGPAVEAYLAK